MYHLFRTPRSSPISLEQKCFHVIPYIIWCMYQVLYYSITPYVLFGYNLKLSIYFFYWSAFIYYGKQWQLFLFFFIFRINKTSTADIRYDLEVALTTHHAKRLGPQIKLFDNINELNTNESHTLAGTKYSKYTCNH